MERKALSEKANNGHHVRWLFHATALVRDYEFSREKLQRLVGCRVLEDTEIRDPMIGRRGGLTWVGDNSLELGQTLLPGEGWDVYVSRFGPGMHMVAVQVSDLEATAAHIEACGVRALARGDHVVMAHPQDTGGIVVVCFGAQLPFDPRFGGPIPDFVTAPLLDVQHMAYIAAVVDDPIDLARRLAEMLDTNVTFEDPDAGPGLPSAGVSLVDNTLALFALPPPDQSIDLWGTRHSRPRTHALGVSVAEIDEARLALSRAGISPVRDDDIGIVLPPDATGLVPLVVTAGLLPGDPRQ